ncbi:MAG: hypothetical protein L0Y72_09845 [Gemmataceae bacterium]|nr:hypothetical protein [Gemmataceae bacterium]MCI0739334.1 hypothetical protein [Gemmataceae bacterium]
MPSYRKKRPDPARVRRAVYPEGPGRPAALFLTNSNHGELLCAWDSSTFETAIDFELVDKALSSAIRRLLRSEGLVFDCMAAAVSHAKQQGWPAMAQH